MVLLRLRVEVKRTPEYSTAQPTVSYYKNGNDSPPSIYISK
jgi:hypothetical protein